MMLGIEDLHLLRCCTASQCCNIPEDFNLYNSTLKTINLTLQELCWTSVSTQHMCQYFWDPKRVQIKYIKVSDTRNSVKKSVALIKGSLTKHSHIMKLKHLCNDISKAALCANYYKPSPLISNNGPHTRQVTVGEFIFKVHEPES